MSQFQYQIQFANEIAKSLERQTKPVVMAATTSSGKSFIVVRVLEQYFKNNPGHKAIFLGSNMAVLADQFYSVLQSNCPVPFSFTYSKLGLEQNTDLKIGLPQKLVRNPQNFNLLVLDEAHWLWEQTHKNHNSLISVILRRCNIQKVLLLTGSPSPFNARRDKYKIHYLSFEDIPAEAAAFASVTLDIVSVKDRNNIEECLVAFYEAAKRRGDNLTQLAIVTRSVLEAQTVSAMLEQRFNLRSLVSTSQHDSDSSNLERFKSGDFDCLVTVNRIVAGWSYNNLTAVLDMAASKNINRSFQVFSRLLRVKDSSTIKYYYRLCLNEHRQRETQMLYKIKSLLGRDVYNSYKGASSRNDGSLVAA
jgi:superfamily II DNA or RNA helicase